MLTKKFITTSLLLWVTFFMFSQQYTIEELQQIDDDTLLELFVSEKKDTLYINNIASVFLERAIKEKDTLKIAKGYDNFSRLYHGERCIQYADSVIQITKNLNHPIYPALGFLLKAREYNSQGAIKEATDNFLIAHELSVKNDNLSFQVFTLGRLIFLKSIWGDKREALSLQKKRHTIITSKNYIDTFYPSANINEAFVSKDELTSIFNFSFCYLNLRKLDSAALYASKGLDKSQFYKGADKEIVVDYFKEIVVEINFYKEKYKESIEKADSLLSKLNYSEHFESIQNLYFFKGVSLIEINQYKEGIDNLIKSDSIFEAENFKIKQPYQKQLFELLYVHYLKEKDTRKQIQYLNKLIDADSIIIKNYQYFEPELIKKLETPELIKEKERLITSLTQKNKSKSTILWWVLGLLGGSLLVTGYYINRQRIYKRRFNALLKENYTTSNTKTTKTSKNELSKEIINEILEYLETFEAKKDYLSTELSMHNLAKSFNTNYKYLSMVINLQKGKNFSNYVNDLRVTYAYEELKNNEKFRKYTIKAIAKDCGFKSSESFSKAFYKKFGIYPSYYVKQLEKNLEA